MTTLHAVTDADQPPNDTGQRLYSSAEVVAAVQLTYRQLDFYCRSGYLPDPRPEDQRGSGTARRFTEAELDIIHAAGALIGAGVTIAAAFDIARHLADTGTHTAVIGSIYQLTVTVRDTTTPTEGTTS